VYYFDLYVCSCIFGFWSVRFGLSYILFFASLWVGFSVWIEPGLLFLKIFKSLFIYCGVPYYFAAAYLTMICKGMILCVVLGFLWSCDM